MFTVVVATLAVNIAANVVSPANDFANAFPRLISFRTGGLITGIIGILMQPWRLLADPSGLYFRMAGRLFGRARLDRRSADRRLLACAKEELELGDLYRPRGVYTYNGGWNWRAVAATLIGCALAWIGLVVPALKPLYDYAWFVGFGASAALHLVLMKLFPPQPSTVVEAEAA